MTPITDNAYSTAELCKNIFITEVRSKPINPINKNEPKPVRSLPVEYPYKLIPPNPAAAVPDLQDFMSMCVWNWNT